MKKLLNRFFRGLIIAFSILDNNNAFCTIELDTLRHKSFINVNNVVIDCIKDLSVLFRKYNSVLEPLKQIEKYPMFFNIPECIFPKAHIHLKPNLESYTLVENIAKITNFCELLYYNLNFG